MQYISEAFDKINEKASFNESFAWRSGGEAREFFDQLYKRGYQGNGNNVEKEKAVPAYHNVCMALKVSDGSTADQLADAYDNATPQQKEEATKIARLALTWGRHNSEIANESACCEESLAEESSVDKEYESVKKSIESLGFKKEYVEGEDYSFEYLTKGDIAVVIVDNNKDAIRMIAEMF